jgi:hypothetical protein
MDLIGKLYKVAAWLYAMGVRNPLIVLVLCTPTSAPTQQNETLQAQEPEDPIEEVLVIGDRPVLQQLRTQMIEAEINAYDIFNKFNDEKRFNISCSMHAPIGSHIARHVCTTNFELEATAAHGQTYLENYRALLDPWTLPDSNPVLHEPVETAIARQLPEYKRKLRQVAEEHPEFLEAIIEYSKIREQYEEAISRGRKNN